MGKNKICLLLGVLLHFSLQAQINQKHWTDGRLTWSDFLEKRSETGFSELNYRIWYDNEKLKLSDTIFYRIKAFTAINLDSSWVHPNYKTANHLLYYQVIFDILENSRREFQHELDRGFIGMMNASYILDKYNKAADSEINRFQQDSQGGTKEETVKVWASILNNKLNDSQPNTLPYFRKRRFGYGMHLGFGSGVFSGSLGNYFNPTFNVLYGFDVSYSKSMLYINATLAGNSVRKDYYTDRIWYKDQRSLVAIIDISYGYELINNRNLKLVPFAGLGITELSGENQDDKNDPLRLVDYNILFGLNTDFKVRKVVKLVPNIYSGSKEYSEASIRTRLYISRADYFSDLRGFSINLSVGFGIFGNGIRVL
jgi:hypothetical protein